MIRLRQLRLDRGMSVADLASASGVSWRAIRRLELTGEEGHAATLTTLASFFDVPPSSLLMPAVEPTERAA
jgi:transcriptional regulator with XRE-family HTH domain